MVLIYLKLHCVIDYRKFNEHVRNKQNRAVDILASIQPLQIKITLQTQKIIKNYNKAH